MGGAPQVQKAAPVQLRHLKIGAHRRRPTSRALLVSPPRFTLHFAADPSPNFSLLATALPPRQHPPSPHPAGDQAGRAHRVLEPDPQDSRRGRAVRNVQIGHGAGAGTDRKTRGLPTHPKQATGGRRSRRGWEEGEGGNARIGPVMRGLVPLPASPRLSPRHAGRFLSPSPYPDLPLTSPEFLILPCIFHHVSSPPTLVPPLPPPPIRLHQERYTNDPLNSPGPIMIKTGVEIGHAQVGHTTLQNTTFTAGATFRTSSQRATHRPITTSISNIEEKAGGFCEVHLSLSARALPRGLWPHGAADSGSTGRQDARRHPDLHALA